MRVEIIKPVLIFCCVLLFACKNEKAQHHVQIVKYKPAACCSSNLPSRFGFKKPSSDVRPFGGQQVEKQL
jgi:hypothetical protein